MIRGPREEPKLIVLPGRLVERLRSVAIRQGVSLSIYAEEVLEQALRVEESGTPLREAVETYQLMDIQKGSGAVQLPRSSLERLVEELYPKNKEELFKIWSEAGRWYGEYLRTKLRDEDVLGFFEKALLVSWNLDDVKIQNDVVSVNVSYTSFTLSLESTELLNSYIAGVMTALGYQMFEEEYDRGMADLRFKTNV